MFIDRRFYELNETVKNDSDYVRSVERCRLDLRGFGRKFTTSKNRPFFWHMSDSMLYENTKSLLSTLFSIRNFYLLSDDAKSD